MTIALGGLEQIAKDHPYLRLAVFHLAHLETIAIATSHLALLSPNRLSRNAIDNLCSMSGPGGKVFNPCPYPLFLVLKDVGDIATSNKPASCLSGMPEADGILSTAISFKQSAWTLELQEQYNELDR